MGWAMPGSEPPTKPIIGIHDLGEIVGFAYRVYLSNFVVLFGLALFTVPLQLLAGAIEREVNGDAVTNVRQAFQFPIAAVVAIITSAIVFATHQVGLGSRPRFSDALDAVFDRLRALFGTAFLAAGCGLAALAAAPFLGIWWWRGGKATIDGRRDWWLGFIPGVLTMYLIIRWAFISQAVVIGDKRNWAALSDSAQAVRGSWWRTLAIMLMLALITVGPFIAASPAARLDPLAAAAIIGLVQAATLPFYAIGQTLLYYDLKTRTAVVPQDPVPLEEEPSA
jgi:hypothetical protein